VRIETGTLSFGEPVRILDAAPLDERQRSSHEGWLIGHGTPPAGHDVTVRIVGEDGAGLPDGSLGEITVAGPNVTDGYHSGREGGSTRFVDGSLHTGDAGFLHDGDLYVLGRMGDALKVGRLNGRSGVYVEDLDVKVAAACGLDRSRLAVVSVYGAASDRRGRAVRRGPGRRRVGRRGEARPLTAQRARFRLPRHPDRGHPRPGQAHLQLRKAAAQPHVAAVPGGPAGARRRRPRARAGRVAGHLHRGAGTTRW
jgi:hypothetical protein